MEDRRITAYLVGRRVVVLNPKEGNLLYSKGFYGKFHAVPKPKTLNIEKELELSYFDTLYLVEKSVLKVVDMDGNEVTLEKMLELFRENFENFDEAYIVYKDFREKGYVVKSGMKFGSTFAVYRYGPGIDHAPFLVHVLPYNSKLEPIEIIRAGRLSHSVRKKLVLAYVDSNGTPHYFVFKWLM